MTNSEKGKMVDSAFLTNCDYRQTVLNGIGEKHIVVPYTDKDNLKIPKIRERKEVSFENLAQSLDERIKKSSKSISYFPSDDQTAINVLTVLMEAGSTRDQQIVCYIPVTYLPPMIADWADVILIAG
jgi:hypothetical protein